MGRKRTTATSKKVETFQEQEALYAKVLEMSKDKSDPPITGVENNEPPPSSSVTGDGVDRSSLNSGDKQVNRGLKDINSHEVSSSEDEESTPKGKKAKKSVHSVKNPTFGQPQFNQFMMQMMQGMMMPWLSQQQGAQDDEESFMEEDEESSTPSVTPSLARDLEAVSKAAEASGSANVKATDASEAHSVLRDACRKEADEQEPDDVVGPDCKMLLRDMLENFLKKSTSQIPIDDLIKKYPRPSNTPFLKSPRIETVIYKTIEQRHKLFDSKCRKIQNYLNAALTAMIGVMDALLKKEGKDPELGLVGLDLKNAMRLVAQSQKEINARRKDALKQWANPVYAPLFSTMTEPSDEWLLGDQLADQMKVCEDHKKMGEKIQKPKKAMNQQAPPQNSSQSNRGRGRGRGRKGRRQYYQQGQNFSPGFPNNQGFFPQGPRFQNPPFFQQDWQNQQFFPNQSGFGPSPRQFNPQNLQGGQKGGQKRQ